MRPPSLLFIALALLTVTLAAPPAAWAQSVANGGVVGSWSAEEPYFRATILIKRSANGELEAFFAGDDLSRGARFSEAAVRGDSVFLTAEHVGASFRGAFSESGPTIRGTWTQGEAAVTLTLTPLAPSAEPVVARPRAQEPTPPFPYASEEVAFESAPGVVLAGTLTVPDGPGPHPAVVLVPGSGVNDRDFEIFGHRPFLVLADHLTRGGMAVLRYDERGAGESGGDPFTVGFDDEARDAAAAMRYLQAHPRVDAAQVGLVGHSMGGLTVAYAHDRLERAAFLVLLAAPGAPLGEVLVEQNVRLMELSGASAAEVEAERALVSEVFRAAEADTDSLTAAAAIRAAYVAAGAHGERAEVFVRAHTAPLLRDLLRYDSRATLERLDVPVLAVFGGQDLFVTAKENEGPIRSALAAAPSGDITVHLVEGMSHWLQPAEVGTPEEVSEIELTVMPDLLDLLVEWVGARTSAGEPRR